MQIFINIVVTFFLMFWPIVFMMSPMMFDAPGSENNKQHIVTMVLILCYPIGLSLLLWLTGIKYFGVNGSTLTAVSSVVVFSGFYLFGYFGMLSNAQKGIANSGYSIAEDQVYYDAKSIDVADSGSFNVLENKRQYSSSDFAVDKKYFYYRGKVVDDFAVDNLRSVELAGDIYWFNKSQIVYDGKILAGANPEQFGGFDNYTGWTYSINNDQYQVYSYGSPLPQVDKDSFTPLNDFIAKDRNHIFEKESPILNGADSVSFELFSNSHDFAKDKDHVYYIATKQPFLIEGADPQSFEIYDRGYLKDKNNVYHVIQYQRIDTLTQADVQSFEETQYDEATQSEARDKNYYYYDGKVVGNR